MERRVRDPDVGAVVEDACLDPPRLARRDRLEAELLTGVDDRVPEVVTSRPVEEVDFEPRDRGPAGAADDDRDVPDLEPLAPVIFDVVDGRADELLERLGRQRPLNLNGVDVRIRDFDVEATLRGDTQSVEAGVGIGELHPPDVRLGVQQDRIVHDPAVGGRHDHVLPLLDCALREVAAGQPVDQRVRIRAAHLHRAFDADIPEGDGLVEQLVFGLRVVVVPGQVHVVVDVVRGASRSQRRLEERRLSIPRSEVQRGALREHLVALVHHANTLLAGLSRADARRFPG